MGHHVVQTSSSAEALEYLDGVRFDCVVAGHDMVEAIRGKVKTPVVALTEETGVQSRLANASTSALLKPCTGYDLAMSVQLTLAVHRPDGFFKIPLSSITPGVLKFDLYTYHEGVHVKLHSKGETIEAGSWGSFVEKPGVELFAGLDGIDQLIPENLRLIRESSAKTGTDFPERAPLFARVGELLIERMQFMGVDEVTIEQTMQFVESFMASTVDAKMIEVLESLEKCDDGIFTDSLCSMAVAVMTARKMRWSDSDLHKVGLAGFFHDIGKLQLPKALLKTPRPLMNFAQRGTYDKHPEMGRAILEKSGLVSKEICDIVHQHHEDNMGTGFPRHLRRDAIHPVARLLRVADLFVSRVVPIKNRRAFPLDKALEAVSKEPGIELEYYLALKELTGSAAAAKAARATAKS